MYDAACAEALGHVRCEFHPSPAEVGCPEHYILNIERRPVRLPENYFEVLACLMRD